MLRLLGRDDPFPPVERALREPNGLLCAGADLSVARLLDAYRRGIFPWYSGGEPILWWSPDPRLVLHPERFRPSRSLRKRVRAAGWRISCDHAFLAVIDACARTPRTGQSGTWIVPEMVAAYTRLHRLGVAHSLEVWEGQRLVGGLYGLAIGRVFFGESMFARVADASKAALWALCVRLRRWDWPLIDCQQQTAHLRSLGAEPMTRKEFALRLVELTSGELAPERWKQADLDPVIADELLTGRPDHHGG